MPGKAGGYPTGPPTVPDVSNSLIRFVSLQAANAVRITSRLTRPPGAELGYPSLVTRIPLRRLVGSKSFPSLLPVTRSARLRFPSGGSLRPPFPPFPGPGLGYDCPVSLSGRFAAARSPIPCLLPPFVSRPAVGWEWEALHQRQGSCSAATPALPALRTRRPWALPSSRVPPLRPCPALRPRWRPIPLPERGGDCCLPPVPPRRLWLPSSRRTVILRSTPILISGRHPAAWPLAPSGFVLPSRGLHAEFAPPPLASLWGGGT